MRPSLPVVPASLSTANGSAVTALDASDIVADERFDAESLAKLARADFKGMEVGHFLMDHFVSRRGDASALKVVQQSVADGSGLRGRILSGDFVRLVARNKPEVYREFSRAYAGDPSLAAWCGQDEDAEVSSQPRPC